MGVVVEMNKRASGGHKLLLKTSRSKIQSKDLKNFSGEVILAGIGGLLAYDRATRIGLKP